MKILVNTPDLSLAGGVAEYLKTLALDQEPNVDLFCIHDYTQANVLKRMITKYIEFYGLAKQYDLIHLHPSFEMKSFFRDMGFIILARLLSKKIVVTMHGWENAFERRVKDNFLFHWLFRITYGCVDAYMVLGEIFKSKLKTLGVKTDKFFIGTTVADDRSSDIESRESGARKLKGRSMIFTTTSLKNTDWSLLNFILGGQNFPKYLIEMDFLDLILFFGGLGSMVYIYLFYKTFIQKLLWHKFFTFFIFSILILAFFGGHFLTSPTSAVYFSLVIIYFQNYRSQQYAKNSTHQQRLSISYQ